MLNETTGPRNEVPLLIDEAARYNAATIRNMADVLYHRRVVGGEARTLVAALDAAIAVQVCLTDMIEPMNRETATTR